MEYEITVCRSTTRTVIVKAETEGEAWEKARKIFKRGKDDFVYVRDTKQK